jgi:hypothetical protein
VSAVKEAERLTQQHLLNILENTYKKGSESPDVSSQQLVEEIAQLLKPYVKSDTASV